MNIWGRNSITQKLKCRNRKILSNKQYIFHCIYHCKTNNKPARLVKNDWSFVKSYKIRISFLDHLQFCSFERSNHQSTFSEDNQPSKRFRKTIMNVLPVHESRSLVQAGIPDLLVKLPKELSKNFRVVVSNSGSVWEIFHRVWNQFGCRRIRIALFIWTPTITSSSPPLPPVWMATFLSSVWLVVHVMPFGPSILPSGKPGKEMQT